ncbi:11725_t:CDS:2, partial [Paraglomus brasilianum]
MQEYKPNEQSQRNEQREIGNSAPPYGIGEDSICGLNPHLSQWTTLKKTSLEDLGKAL